MTHQRPINDEMRHLSYLGLRHNPFPVAPDNANFFISETIDRVITNIVHGVLARKGFMVLTGDIGLGKTTISRRLITLLEKKGVATSLVFHTTYQDVELLREIINDFGLESASLTFSDQMNVLNRFLLDQSNRGKNCAIIIDDAQNLNRRSLELVRMISNLEADRQKLVQILLIGQPELMDKLNTFELRQLKSRIIITERVRPMTNEELKYYLIFKMNAAGINGRIQISRRGFKKLYRLTKGNFRKVNVLMDRCLYVAFLMNSKIITKKVVAAAEKDLHPERNGFRFFKWSTATAVALFLSASVTWGLILPTFSHRSLTEPSVVSKKIDYPNPIRYGETNLESGPRTTQSAVTPDSTQIKEDLKPVSTFMAAYNLSEYQDAFIAALKTGRVHELSETLFKQTGYELVSLAHLPGQIRGKYGILSYPTKPDGTLSHFLLWRPSLRLQAFYPSYQGNEIFRLQEILARLKLYTFKKDGIVGKRLISAINRFQASMNLPVTGYPDPQTLFLLCHQDGL
jgi:general secretion pathway protein A